MKNETSQPAELLLSVSSAAPGDARRADRGPAPRRRSATARSEPGTPVPSTRDLARQLGISRRIVVDAYAQLAAEGYLTAPPGRARPHGRGRRRVGAAPAPAARPATAGRASAIRLPPERARRRAPSPAPPGPLPASRGRRRSPTPTSATATRAASRRSAPRSPTTSAACAAWWPTPERVVVTSGYSQGLSARLPRARRARRAADRARGRRADPEYARDRRAAAASSRCRCRSTARASGSTCSSEPVSTPSSSRRRTSTPTGAVLSRERRTALLAWLRDARRDRDRGRLRRRVPLRPGAVGALQGLEPDRVVYAGTARKTLAPALRLGWLVVPARLLERCGARSACPTAAQPGSSSTRSPTSWRADELDRHLRRMRLSYAAAAATRSSTPSAASCPRRRVHGIAAGLHVTVELSAARRRTGASWRRRVRAGSAFEAMSDYGVRDGPPTLMLGYGHLPEAAVRPGVRGLAEAIRAARERAA